MLSFAELHGVECAEDWAELRRHLSMQIAELARNDRESPKRGKAEYLRYYARSHNRRSEDMRQVA
jgi:hypothetical protein